MQQFTIYVVLCYFIAYIKKCLTFRIQPEISSLFLWEHTIDEKLGQTPCICIGSKDHPWIEDLTA